MGGIGPVLEEILRYPSSSRRQGIDAAINAGVLTEAQAREGQAALDQLDQIALQAALQIGQVVATPGLAFELAEIQGKPGRLARTVA